MADSNTTPGANPATTSWSFVVKLSDLHLKSLYKETKKERKRRRLKKLLE